MTAAPRGAWRWLGSRPGRLALMLALPITIVILVSLFVGSNLILSPDDVEAANEALRLEAARGLSDLSKDMSALTVGILAAVILLMKEVKPQQRTRRFIKGVIVAATFSVLSIYLSIRFRYAISLQTWENKIDLGRIDFLYYLQFLSLTVALSILMLLAAAVYIPRSSESEE